jgi:hypothetical protein
MNLFMTPSNHRRALCRPLQEEAVRQIHLPTPPAQVSMLFCPRVSPPVVGKPLSNNFAATSEGLTEHYQPSSLTNFRG